MLHFEDPRVDAKKVKYSIFSLAGLVVAVGIFALLFQHHLTKNYTDLKSPPVVSPRAQVEFESGILFKNLQKEQMARLNSYAGLKEHSTAVQVPIERAMQYILEKKSLESKDLFPGDANR